MHSRIRRPAICLAASWLAFAPVSAPAVAAAAAPEYQIVEITPGGEVKGAPPVEGKAPSATGHVSGLRYATLGQGYVGETEPNGTFATASPIAGTNAVVRASVFPNADVDWYSFVAAAGDRVHAAILTSFSANASSDSQLRLYGTDGTTLIEADEDDGSLGALSSTIAGAAIPAAGTYFLEVRHFSATNQLRPYELHLRLQSGAPTPEVEPNDAPATATPLPASGWVSGTRDPALATEQDWYSFTLSAGDTVFLSLNLDPERDNVQWNGRLGLGLFGDASNQILVVDDASTGSVANPLSEAMFFTVKNAGTYYAFVDSATAATGGPTATYILSVSVHPSTNEGVSCTVYTSTDIPKTIGPGAGLVSSTITVPGNPRIADLDVEVVLDHALMADIDVHLRSPAGNDNGLFSDIGAAATGGQTQMNLWLDDEAALPPTFTVLSPLRLKPELAYRLSWFDGENAGGTWTLDLRDDGANASGGTLTSWSIRVCEPPPPPTCAAGFAQTTVFATDFEAGDAGFTHSGTGDEWTRGLPTAAPITTCNSGVNCWKTDLAGGYNASSTQDLLSPAINLAGLSGPVMVTWAQQYQIENASFDHMSVDYQQVGGATPVRLFEWQDATMTSVVGNPTVTLNETAGWALFTRQVDSLAGLNTELRFHLDADTTVQLSGLAVDDVSVTACRPLSADLSITKTDGVATATPGGSVTYTITASNAGADPVTGATVADTFPALLTCTWTCAGAGGGTCTAAGSGNINDLVNLPSGGSVTYTASCAVSAAAAGTLSNTATVASSVTDPVPANNSATDTDTLVPQADLGITKTDGVTTAVPGQSVTYSITASNPGPSNAPGSTVADTFPAAATCTWTCIGSGGASCTAAGSGNIGDLANLPVGGSVTYTAACSILASATGSLSNTATVASAITDPNPANNSATDTDTLVPQLGLSMAKSDGLVTAVAGQAITYTVTASNAGPSSAASATVTDTFPAAFTGAVWTCASAGGATCTAAGSGDLVDAVALPVGGSVIYTINGTLSAAFTGILSNTATVTSGTATADATDTTDVTSPASVSGTKSVSGNFIPGGAIAYTIVLTNSGSLQLDNPGDELVDVLPAQLVLVSASATSGTATTSGNNVHWNGSIPAGGTVTITIQATILSIPPGQVVTNQGQISFDGDGNGTNEATASTDDPSLPGASDTTAFAVVETAIPLLPPAGLGALAASLAALGFGLLRRRTG